MNDSDLLKIISRHKTPFYLYDLNLLGKTIKAVKDAASVNPKFKLNYAMKACYEMMVLEMIRSAGFGIDAVSGGEIKIALDTGFQPEKIMFAGVGKTDEEINFALDSHIQAFNVESLPELEIIDELAHRKGVSATVALRVNPGIDAHTHHYITTGLSDNKFGLNPTCLETAFDIISRSSNLKYFGLHFHIGSQITVMEPFRLLCEKINNIVETLHSIGIETRNINLGGGLGIDYEHTDNRISDFKSYFEIINSFLNTKNLTTVYFEPGRSIVGSCGALITKVLYVKESTNKTFVIVDGGMTELIRPALYGAIHPIRNISGEIRGSQMQKVDIVGPICESSDTFANDYMIAAPRRGDIIMIEKAGAYGHVMSSHYNARTINQPLFITEVV